MKRKAIVCFAFIVLFLVSICTLSIFAGAARYGGGPGFSYAQPTEDWWPMFRHDLTYSGNSNSTAPNTNQTLWKYNIGGQAGSPIVVGGVVYVGSYDDKIYALDASNDALLWSYLTHDMVVSSPAVANGIVYVGSYDHMVYAFGTSQSSQPFTPTLFIVLLLILLLASLLLAVAFYRRKH
jgi:outer membrane protein assembly factor BamB